MAEKKPTDAQLLAKLRRSNRPKTAGELGTTAARLRSLDGVVEAGRVHTGRAGRPAVLFTLAQGEADDRSGTSEESQLARSGEQSAVQVN